MRVWCHEGERLVWLAIALGAYSAAVRFFGETQGLQVAFDEGNTIEGARRDRDRIQLFRPRPLLLPYCRGRGAGIVPLLEVDDLGQASAQLLRGGAELIGGPESNGTWTWLTFRTPDGNIHSLGARTT
jgi:hypothetical protein